MNNSVTQEKLERSPSAAPSSQQPSRQRYARSEWTRAILIAGIVVAFCVLLVVGMTMDIPREIVGLLVVILVLTMVFCHISVGVSMGLGGAIGFLVLGGSRVMENTLAEAPFGATAQFTLAVMPMFIFMGLMLWRSGVTNDLYRFVGHWMRWLPGGLAITTNLAGAGLGAVSGSTIGITHAVGRIGIPEMVKAGYGNTLAAGSVLSAGTIGQLIPPSILLVVYAGFAETPIGPQLLAGIVPGVLLALSYSLFIVLRAIFRPDSAPRPKTVESVSAKEKLLDTVRIWPIVLIMVTIIGGLSSGLFTATEVGAVGAILASVICLGRIGFKPFLKAARNVTIDTLIAVGSIMFMLIGAQILSQFLALSGTAQWFAGTIEGMNLEPIALILVLIVFYLVLGAFMDPIPMMLLTIPLLTPAVTAAGFSPIWFGVFLVLLGEVAILSPPIGVLSFVVHRMMQDEDVTLGRKVSLVQVFKAALYFIPAALLVVIVITIWPELVTWLPDAM